MNDAATWETHSVCHNGGSRMRLGMWTGFILAALGFGGGAGPRAGAAARAAVTYPGSSTAGRKLVPADVRAIRQVVERVAAFGANRAAGTLGAEQTANFYAGRLAEVTRRPVWREAFTEVVPRVRLCQALDPERPGMVIPIYALAPCGAQLPALRPTERTAAPLIYAGDGRLQRLSGKTVAGAWVALNINSGRRWIPIAGLGARGIIFLGSPGANFIDFQDKVVAAPVSIPRLFVANPVAAQAIRRGQVRRLRVRIQAGWVRRTVANILCLIPARSEAAGAGGPPNWTQPLIVLAARYDASSYVLGRAPGATEDLSAAVLLQLARRLRGLAVRHNVLIALTAGNAWDFQGTRELLRLLLQPTAHWQAVLARRRRELDRVVRLTREIERLAGRGRAARSLLSCAYLASHRHLRDALKGELERELTNVSDRLWRRQEAGFNARTAGAGSREGVSRSRGAIEPASFVARGVSNGCEVLPRRREPPLTLRAIKADRCRSPPARNSHLGSGGRSVAILRARKLQLMAARNGLDSPARLRRAGPLILGALRRLAPVWREQLRLIQAKADRARQWLQIRQALGPSPLPLEIYLDAHLTGGGRRFGLFARSGYLPISNNDQMAQFARLFGRRYDRSWRRIYAGQDPPQEDPFDARTLQSVRALADYFPIPMGFSSDYSLWRGVPAATFATIRDASGLIDTPYDTPGRINWRHVAAQVRMLRRLLLGSPRRQLVGALDDPEFNGRIQSSAGTDDQPIALMRFGFGETVPNLPAPHYLIGVHLTNGGLPPLEGTWRSEWRFTGRDGGVNFRRLLRPNGAWGLFYQMQAMNFKADGRPKRVLAGQGNEAGKNYFYDPFQANVQRELVFRADPISLFGLFNPRYLAYMNHVEVLDAARQGEARYYTTYCSGPVAVAFVPPDLRWQILLSRGPIANDMVLLNASAAHPLGTGFGRRSRRRLEPLVWRGALDMHYLDAQRRRVLAHYGVVSAKITRLMRASTRYLAGAAKARRRRLYQRWLGAAAAAWSDQAQAYHRLIRQSNGLVDAAIFLLLGLIPFSYFLERLLIGSPNVYRQIGGFAAIFAVMTALLASFHPAFRITRAPLMILLAFLILLLSAIVIHILWGKFEEELSRLRSQAGATHSANLKRSALAGAALRLGLSNLRRRGLRTALTLTTLVLITFTLLCFTSVKEGTAIIPTVEPNAPARPPQAILLRQRGWAPLPRAALSLARQVAGPGGTVAPRYWYVSENSQATWQLPIAPVGRGDAVLARPKVNALLGLSVREKDFVAGGKAQLARALPGWGRSKTGQPACWLPASLRNHPFERGELVRILGVTLRIAGFFPTHDFPLRQITGESFWPVDAAASAAQPQPSPNLSPRELAALPEPNLTYLNAAQVAIVPARLVRRMGGVLTSILIRPAEATAASLEQAARRLARRSAFAVLVSNGRQVWSYNAASGTALTHLSNVLAPLFIAALIVLNTMLGAVAERRHEIHTYTALGLAPGHVGALFLAEAAALGTLGVVFGYIAGQAVATLLEHTHLLPGVRVNYSSLSAITTMGLVLGLVMLSTLWPARMASRVAAPSLQRTWKLPPPRGDRLELDLPFTVNALAAHGVCAFLEEFFTTTTQTGLGRFSAANIAAFVENGVRGLSCRIWLAPYDRGVMQDFRLAIHPTTQSNVFEVKLTLEREAGTPAAWLRFNRPFLVEVRKQFLLWRALTADVAGRYVARSEAMFSGMRV